MRALIDTCVAIDFLQKRTPLDQAAYKLFSLTAIGCFSGFLTAKSITDIYYLEHRFTHSDAASRTQISLLLELVGILDTSGDDILRALASDTRDFEDAVMIESALRGHMDYVITRNTKDYEKAPLPVCTPDDFLHFFETDRDCRKV